MYIPLNLFKAYEFLVLIGIDSRKLPVVTEIPVIHLNYRACLRLDIVRKTLTNVLR